MTAKVLLAALLLSAVPASAQSRVGPAPYLVVTLSASLDLATTLDVLHSGRGQEGNPVLAHGGQAGLIAGKLATTAATLFAMRQFGLKGHPRIAAAIGYLSGIGAVAAVHNLTVGR
jgi:hypothetical protein